MKTLWKWLASTHLTIVLSLLIVVDVLIGTFVLSVYADAFGTINAGVFYFWLVDAGLNNIGISWWIFLLLVLLAVLALNTIACVVDSIATAINRRREGRALARRLVSQTLHLGFVIALVGNLISNTTGQKTADIQLAEGATVAIPGAPGLSLRLNKVDGAFSARGGMERMDAALSLLLDDREIKQQIVRLNEPLLYRGHAVYITHQGKTPQGIRLRAYGNGVSDTVRVLFTGRPAGQFRDYRIILGRMLPNFALDAAGKAYSDGNEFHNPALELIVFKAHTELARGWVFLRSANQQTISFDGYELSLSGLDYRAYAVLTINNDPGAIIALAGGLIFMVALIALLLMRGKDAELVKEHEGGSRHYR